MKMPANFQCPKDMVGHLKKVFDGEYDIPGLNPRPGHAFKILDLGANCGAFALWALSRWPGSTVTCYEPMPTAYNYLVQNLSGVRAQATLVNAAVTGREPGHAPMHVGKYNIGEASLLSHMGTDTVEVATVPPRDLPAADILKLDIEGSELEVLFYLVGFEQRSYSAILLEYHSEPIRRALDAILKDYTLVAADIACPGRGTLCYVHSALR